MQKIRIMLAGTRRTAFPVLVRMLERAGDELKVVEQVCGEAEACVRIVETGADVVLVDASVPDAFALCGSLTYAYPDLCVMLVGGSHSYDCLKRAMDMGARGYVSDDECTGECIRAEINRVLRIGSGQTDAVVHRPLPSSELAGRSRAVMKVMNYVQQNYHRNISVANAADYAGISESHLRRCFRQETGMSFVDYLTHYRIDIAKSMMKREEKPIHIISEETGFSSTRYFCRVFKKITNMTPREYMRDAFKEDAK